ncbi:hypothetical protein LF844_23105 [Metapseudomonas lalkuanensis]|uniref:hypothetical protein n=1 Tax=Metapseudomonas lalkuanensis TaxID=2604832 RepID=UPI001CF32DB4|nr:hypothetical protein [Pseudomonas lalkuanensis]UCO97517.1 hypothetical protein LF844_23105 [Pseudomonas lalkuanensis]
MDAELIINLWALYDGSTGTVYALAGRAYNIAGTDREKLDFLKMAARTDYVTAKRYRVPDRFGIVFPDGQEHTGVVYLNAVSDPNAQLFEELFNNLEADLPPLPRFSVEGASYVPQRIPNDPLCITTVLYEDDAGNIRPVVTDEDRAWVRQHEARLHGY